MMSTKITSGRWSVILASASKPSSASSTLQPAWVRKISALRRIVLLSSITITFSPAMSMLCSRCVVEAKNDPSRRPPGSDLDHLEVFLARMALRAGPVGRDVFPARARRDALVGQAGGLVVDEAANQAHPGLVGGIGHESALLEGW